MPPVSPMLSKSVKAIPDVGHVEPKWDGFRTIVFKDGDEVELGSRNERPMTRYFPELVEALRQNLPPRCVVDGEIILATRRPPRLRRPAAAHPPRRRAASTCSRRRRRRRSSPSTCSPSATTTSWASRSASVAALLVEALAGAEDPVFVTPATADLAEAKRLVHPVRGRRPRRRGRQAARRHLPARQAHDVQDQARAHRRLRGRRVPLAQERRDRGVAAARAVRRRRTPAPRRRRRLVPDGPAREPRRRARAARRGRPVAASVGRMGRPGGAREQAPDAGSGQQVERGQEPLVRAAAARARRRGRLRPDGGRPVPAHGAVPALAHRSHARELHLRPAGVAVGPRPVRDPAVAAGECRVRRRRMPLPVVLRARCAARRRARCGARRRGSSR